MEIGIVPDAGDLIDGDADITIDADGVGGITDVYADGIKKNYLN
jgi:hypothetical protein